MIETRKFAEGTSTLQEMPWGVYRGGKALCSDGRVRRLSRIAPTADTVYSVPAAVQIGHKRASVAGFVTVACPSGLSTETAHDRAVATFVAHGKNAALLPGAPKGRKWRVTFYGRNTTDEQTPGVFDVWAFTADGAVETARALDPYRDERHQVGIHPVEE